MSFSVFNKLATLSDYEYTKEAIEVEDDSKISRAVSTFCWCPGVFLWGHRLKSNFVYADWLGLDFDDGPSLDEMTKVFSDMECIIGTTKSHQKQKGDKPPCDRFRVVLKLDHRCDDIRDFEATTRDLINRYDADQAAKDCSRYFRPCHITYNTIGQIDLYTQEVVKAPAARPVVVTRPAGGKFYKSPLYRSTEAMPALVTRRNERLYLIGIDLKRQGLTEVEIFHEIDRLIPCSPDFPEKEKRSILSSIMKANR